MASPFGAAGLGNRQGGQLRGVVGVGHAHGRGDVVRALDVAVLRLPRSLTTRVLTGVCAPKKLYVCTKWTFLALRTRQFGEAAAGRAPVRRPPAPSSPCGPATSPPARTAQRCPPSAARRRRRLSGAPNCGTTSTSLASNFSTPAGLPPLAAIAATMPFSFDSPHGLFTRIRPGLVALNAFWGVLEHRLVHHLVHGGHPEARSSDWRRCA